MPHTTPAQQPPIRCALPHLKRIAADEQAIAQEELNQYVAEQAQAIAPTTDFLTSRDRHIISEIIQIEPESIRTLWIEGGITVWVQLVDGGRLAFERDWFASRVAEVKVTLPETPRERNERLSEELETACQKYGLTHGEVDWLSFSTTLYVNRQRIGFLGCNLQGQWYSRQSQLGGSRTAVDIDAAIALLGVRETVAA
ncbi:hypothetical protein [Nostoc sp. FACHB-190]|uniref:hypothetical protein n=1 Tax=Nostoc sp. FACHB-190 TaxID=2692838 RepID=UPI001687C893|nr:hypothetical protein [Nostoc sp. FACHB-190]MBD2302774.1 hypothetical protein [Nostoc sp. FACHB-190]